MLTTRTPPQTCPCCRKFLDATTHILKNHVPKVGDLTLCIECCAVLVFEPGMTMRLFTTAEIATLPNSTLADLERQQRAIREMHTQRRRANARNN
jgi:hypothetical protein